MTSTLAEAFAAALLLGQWVLADFAIRALPRVIPTHFASNGLPDRTGPSTTLWVLPALGVVTYLVMSLAQRARPRKLNLLVTITDRNRDAVLALAAEMQRVLKACIMLLLLGMEWGTIGAAVRGSVAAPFFAALAVPPVAIVAILVVYSRRMRAV